MENLAFSNIKAFTIFEYSPNYGVIYERERYILTCNNEEFSVDVTTLRKNNKSLDKSPLPEPVEIDIIDSHLEKAKEYVKDKLNWRKRRIKREKEIVLLKEKRIKKFNKLNSKINKLYGDKLVKLTSGFNGDSVYFSNEDIIKDIFKVKILRETYDCESAFDGFALSNTKYLFFSDKFILTLENDSLFELLELLVENAKKLKKYLK